MSNAKTGFFSALGAVAGGIAGAMSAKYIVTSRPRIRYAAEGMGDSIEDAMVVGGATGAVVGAFIGGTISGEEPPPPQLPPR